MTDIASFYDALAPAYDAMTGFDKRIVHEGPFFRLLVARHGITRALDAGAGTGFHSFLLARLGVAVTAVDLSGAMLERLDQHAAEFGLPVETLQSSFQDIPGRVTGAFDAVFCMGNGLAHLLTRDALLDALRAFHAVMKPEGVLFLQVLNYDRILDTRQRKLGVKDTEAAKFVRYYTFSNDLIQFNILTCRKPPAQPRRELQTVTLRPILHLEFSRLLGEAGFRGVRLFGSIAMEEFEPDKSRDLVVLAFSDTAGQR